MPDSTRPRSSPVSFVAPSLGADSPLAALPLTLQALFWTTFTAAVEAALAESRPARADHQDTPHRSEETLRQRQQRLTRLTIETLEALDRASSAPLLAQLSEQCVRLGRCYADLTRQVGGCCAWLVLRWDIRRLRYRACPTLAALIGLEPPVSC